MKNSCRDIPRALIGFLVFSQIVGAGVLLGSVEKPEGKSCLGLWWDEFWKVESIKDTTSPYRLFGAEYEPSLITIRETVEGDFIVLGGVNVYRYEYRYEGSYLLKVDSAGNEIWSKVYLTDVGSHGSTVDQTTDSGYVIVGFTNDDVKDAKHNIYVIKVNAQGNKQWTKMYDYDYDVTASDIKRTDDGGFLIVGTIRYPQIWTGLTEEELQLARLLYKQHNDEVFVLKIDSLGNELWYNSFGGFHDEQASNIELTSDGGCIICATSPTSKTDDLTGNLTWSEIYLIKLDSAGNEEWEASYGSETEAIIEPSVEGLWVQEAENGGYIACGSMWSNFNYIYPCDYIIVKVNSNGEPQSIKQFSWRGKDIRSLRQVTDGCYVVAGITSITPQDQGELYTPAKHKKIYAAMVNEENNEIWSRTFDREGAFDMTGEVILQTADGGFIIGGTTGEMKNRKGGYSSYSSYIMLIKIDAEGNVVWGN